MQNVICKQTSLQICIGLHSILKAISFLHEKALSSHNNICQASVYVTPEGHWKLAGLEYLCRFSDLSARFLSESRQGRYDRGVAPNENNRVPQPPCGIDQYAFGVFVEEVLKPRTDGNVPGLLDFFEYCKN
uniref:Protein-associating with the carboxyl-terminal domain of ezrin n=1 Tax=Triatoma infestans TaxID=30076 RepID=A0A170YVL2_TRIIF